MHYLGLALKERIIKSLTNWAYAAEFGDSNANSLKLAIDKVSHPNTKNPSISLQNIIRILNWINTLYWIPKFRIIVKV